MPARRFIVSGRVQGVGFRQFAATMALKLGLNGWARNLVDGRVEVFAEGDVEIIEDLRRHLTAGPPSARVESVESFASEPVGSTNGFRIKS